MRMRIGEGACLSDFVTDGLSSSDRRSKGVLKPAHNLKRPKGLSCVAPCKTRNGLRDFTGNSAVVVEYNDEGNAFAMLSGRSWPVHFAYSLCLPDPAQQPVVMGVAEGRTYPGVAVGDSLAFGWDTATAAHGLLCVRTEIPRAQFKDNNHTYGPQTLTLSSTVLDREAWVRDETHVYVAMPAVVAEIFHFDPGERLMDTLRASDPELREIVQQAVDILLAEHSRASLYDGREAELALLDRDLRTLLLATDADVPALPLRLSEMLLEAAVRYGYDDCSALVVALTARLASGDADRKLTGVHITNC